MGFFEVLWKNNIQKAYLPKIIAVQGKVSFSY